MLSFNDKISLRQLQVLLIVDILGTGVIVLPRRVADYASQDGWFVVLLMTAIAIVCTFIIMSLGSLFKDKTFYEYTGKIIGRPIAFIISICFIIKIFLNTALEIRFFSEIIKQTILPQTPFYVVFICLISVSAFAAAKGFETRARIAEVLLPIIFIPLIIVYILAAIEIDFTNLMPVLKTNVNNFSIGTYYSMVSFTGLEFLLLVYPYLQRPKNARKSSVMAVGLVGICMTIITAITIAKFGYQDVKRQIWPVVELMDIIDLPGAFIERQDALMVSFWIISVFSIVSAGLFFSAIQLKSVFKKLTHTKYILISIPIIILIAYVPKNIDEVIKYMDFVYLTFGIAFMFIIPTILLIIAKLRKMGDKI